MNAQPKLYIAAFKSNSRVASKHYSSISSSMTLLDGERLDEIQLTATIKSVEDADDLVRLILNFIPSLPETRPGMKG